VSLLPLIRELNRAEGIPWRRARTLRALRRLCQTPKLGFCIVSEETGRGEALAGVVGYAIVTYAMTWSLAVVMRS
jgi:hypothetical protein